MDTLINIAHLLMLLSISALCLYLIATLMSLRASLILFQKEFSELSTKMKPVLANLEVITEKAKNVFIDIETQVKALHGSLDAFRSVLDNIVSFERRLEDFIETPIVRLTSFFNDIVGLVTTSLGFLRSRKAPRA